MNQTIETKEVKHLKIKSNKWIEILDKVNSKLDCISPKFSLFKANQDLLDNQMCFGNI